VIARVAPAIVERRRGLSPTQFVVEHLQPRRPVILTDAIEPWTARAWTPARLQETVGARTVTIDGRPQSMRAYLDALMASTPERPAPHLRNAVLHRSLPELLADVTPLPPYLANNWLVDGYRLRPLQSFARDLAAPDLFIGPPGAQLRLLRHIYNVHSFAMQLYGRNEVTLYPPEQSALMYPEESADLYKSQILDIRDVDAARFPLFAQATPLTCALSAGETLFVPGGWWQSSRVVETSIHTLFSIANQSNWQELVDELHFRMHHHGGWRRAVSGPLRRYMTWLGRQKARESAVQQAIGRAT
jgi:histone arginine demethylase JMJD6